MERQECEEKIIELMKQIKAVANEYYGGDTYLSFTIFEDGTMLAFNDDSYNDGDKPIDAYVSAKERGEQDGEHKG